MRNVWTRSAVLVLFVAVALAGNGEAATPGSPLDAGVGAVDITPADPVVLAGSPTPLKSSSVGTRLYARALVLAAGRQKAAIVALDTLKYPVEHVVRACRQIEQTTGIRIGDDFAIVTSPDELFCGIGMSIKKQSPFKHTMVVEQTNGAHGYVPTAKAFAGGSYETWFGEHSYLTTRAGEIIEKESLDILNRLKRAE